MLLAHTNTDGKQEIVRLTNFCPIPKAMHKLIGTTDALVLGALLSYAGSDGRCYPKCQTIADACGQSLRAVKYSLSRMREKGLIVTERKNRRRGLTYRFLWNDIWKLCLAPKKTSRLKEGTPFNPYGMFPTFNIPRAIMSDNSLTAVSRIFMGYILDRMGTNGKAWPAYSEIAADLNIVCRNTISTAIKELTALGVLSYTKGNTSENEFTTNVYVLHLNEKIANDFNTIDGSTREASERMETAHVQYADGTSAASDLHYHKTPNEEHHEKKGVGRQTSSSSPSSHYNDLGATENVVVPEMEKDAEEAVAAFMDSLPETGSKDRLRASLQEIISKVDPIARLKMALQVVMTRGIQNKAAYLTTLIMRYQRGQYNVDGVELMKADFARRVRSEYAQFFVHSEVEEL